MIESIKISNMRGFAGEFTMDLAPHTMITGWLGSGKTTVLDAIELLLLGSNRLTTPSGAGAAAMKRTAAKPLVIEGVVTGLDGDRWRLAYWLDGGTRGKCSAVGMSGGNDGEVLDTLPEFWARIGRDMGAATMAIRAVRSMDGASFGAAYMEQFGEPMTVARLREFLAATNHADTAHAQHLGLLADVMGGHDKIGRMVAGTEWQQAGTACYMRRTAIKKQMDEIKRLHGAFAPTPRGADGQELDAAQIPAVRAQLADLEKKHHEYRTAQSNRAALDAALARIGGDVTDADRAAMTASNAAALADIRAFEDARPPTDRRVTFAAERVNTVGADIDGLRKQYAALDAAINAAHGACSECGRQHTEDSSIYALRAARLDRLAVEESIRNTEAELGAARIECIRAADDYRAEEAEFVQAQHRLAEARAVLAEFGSRIVDIEAADKLRARLGVDDGTDYAALIEAVNARIEQGGGILKMLDAKAGHDAREREIQAMTGKVKELGEAVDMFGGKDGPGEFGAWCSAQTAGRFVELANPILTGTGYAVSLQTVGGDLRVHLDHDGHSVEIGQASTGERCMAGAAVAAAFSARAGIIIVDNLDNIDGRTRPVILDMLGAVPGVQVIAAGHWGGTEAPVNLDALSRDSAPYVFSWMQG